MLQVNNVVVASGPYGAGYEATVEFQVGDKSYSTVKVKLTPEATREIVEAIVAKASAMLVVVPTDIKIAGEPEMIPLVDEPPAPEFAEVDEAPTDTTTEEFKPEEAF